MAESPEAKPAHGRVKGGRHPCERTPRARSPGAERPVEKDPTAAVYARPPGWFRAAGLWALSTLIVVAAAAFTRRSA